MAINKKQTSAEVATLASKVLQRESASQIQKQLAAAALAQSRTRKQTGAEMEDLAAKVLANKRYSDETRTLAGAVLSQANRAR